MNILDQSVELWPIPCTPEETLKHIERAGRVCYKSEDKITDGSAEKFIRQIIERGHESVLEHGNIILLCNKKMYKDFRQYQKHENALGRTVYLRFSKLYDPDGMRYIVSGNIRAWRACVKFFVYECCLRYNWVNHFIGLYHWAFFDLVHDVENSTAYDPDRSAKIITIKDLRYEAEYLTHVCITQTAIVDRGITHELVRHRPASYSQESTRYCNYAKGKFGGEITVIDPEFTNDDAGYIWEKACTAAEQAYDELIKMGVKPQIARSVLPTCLKAELVITANLRELLHMVNLRSGEGAHPQAIKWAVDTRNKLVTSLHVMTGDMLDKLEGLVANGY